MNKKDILADLEKKLEESSELYRTIVLGERDNE